MKAIAFELKGKTAFFKKPDVNANVYFTYSHIHKISLYGLIGAIIGLGGYTKQHENMDRYRQSEENKYPEFYQRLHGLQVAIVPHGDRGYFSKKIQTFSNTVGYASQEEGGNLIVREQWLENPHWTIYIWNDNHIEEEIFHQIEHYLLCSLCEYVPYLGKNDHPACIENARIVKLKEVQLANRIQSLLYTKHVSFTNKGTYDEQPPHFFQEYMPVRLHPDLNYYEFEEVSYTNRKIQGFHPSVSTYETEGYVIVSI